MMLYGLRVYIFELDERSRFDEPWAGGLSPRPTADSKDGFVNTRPTGDQ